MNILSDAVKEINEASRKIANGELDEPIVSLTNSLKNLRSILSADPDIAIPSRTTSSKDHDCPVHQYYATSSSSPCCLEYGFLSSTTSSSFLKTYCAGKGSKSNYVNESESFACPITADNLSRQSDAQHDRQMSIFRDPMIVQGKYFRVTLDKQLCEELSYVAIYNLALAHHLKSMEFISSRHRLGRIYLRKALSLYEHSHLILMKQRISSSVPTIHSMALVCNLGQIHNALGDQEKAEMCLEYLLSTLMYVIDSGMADTVGNSMDGFLDLIMPLVSTDEPSPAA